MPIENSKLQLLPIIHPLHYPRLVPAEWHLLFALGQKVSNADRRETMNANKTINNK